MKISVSKFFELLTKNFFCYKLTFILNILIVNLLFFLDKSIEEDDKPSNKDDIENNADIEYDSDGNIKHKSDSERNSKCIL